MGADVMNGTEAEGDEFWFLFVVILAIGVLLAWWAYDDWKRGDDDDDPEA